MQGLQPYLVVLRQVVLRRARDQQIQVSRRGLSVFGVGPRDGTDQGEEPLGDFGGRSAVAVVGVLCGEGAEVVRDALDDGFALFLAGHGGRGEEGVHEERLRQLGDGGLFGDADAGRERDAGNKDVLVGDAGALGRDDVGPVGDGDLVDDTDQARVPDGVAVLVHLERWAGNVGDVGDLGRLVGDLGDLAKSGVGETGLCEGGSGEVKGEAEGGGGHVDTGQGPDAAVAQEGFGGHVGAVGEVEDGGRFRRGGLGGWAGWR